MIRGGFFGSRCPRQRIDAEGGRASWRAVAPTSPCPMRLGGSLALPIRPVLNFHLQGGGRVNADFLFSPRCEENEGAPFRNAHLRVASANHRRRERNCRKIFPCLFSASHAVDFDQFKAPQPQRTLTLRCLLPSRLSVEILTEISP